MGSLIAIGLPILAALIPALLKKGTDGNSPGGDIWRSLGGLFKNTWTAPSSTIAGGVGSGVLGLFMLNFPCIGDITNWQNLATAAVPLLFGALSQDRGPAQPAEETNGSPTPEVSGPLGTGMGDYTFTPYASDGKRSRNRNR